MYNDLNKERTIGMYEVKRDDIANYEIIPNICRAKGF